MKRAMYLLIVILIIGAITGIVIAVKPEQPIRPLQQGPIAELQAQVDSLTEQVDSLTAQLEAYDEVTCTIGGYDAAYWYGKYSSSCSEDYLEHNAQYWYDQYYDCQMAPCS